MKDTEIRRGDPVLTFYNQWKWSVDRAMIRETSRIVVGVSVDMSSIVLGVEKVPF